MEAERIGTAFNRAKIAAGMDQRDLHFHDLRGTAATRFYKSGLSEPVIAEIMAWDREHVSRASYAAMWAGPPQPRPLFANSIRPKRERKMQNRMQNRPPEIELSGWSGRRESNPRMQLGKLPFCH
jgi:integrase